MKLLPIQQNNMLNKLNTANNIKSNNELVTQAGFTNPTTIFPRPGSFYPFSILAKIHTKSEFEANFHKPTGKKDNFRDK